MSRQDHGLQERPGPPPVLRAGPPKQSKNYEKRTLGCPRLSGPIFLSWAAAPWGAPLVKFTLVTYSRFSPSLQQPPFIQNYRNLLFSRVPRQIGSTGPQRAVPITISRIIRMSPGGSATPRPPPKSRLPASSLEGPMAPGPQPLLAGPGAQGSKALRTACRQALEP